MCSLGRARASPAGKCQDENNLIQSETVNCQFLASRPDSVTNLIESLKFKNSELDSEVKFMEKLLESRILEIDSLKKQIAFKNSIVKRFEVKNDSLQREFISLASNFIYIPYDSYSINQIAIPAFNMVKGTELYNHYLVRLTLLENYTIDIKYLVDFLTKATTNLDFGINSQFERQRKQKIDELMNQLDFSDTNKRYDAYDDGANTFIGSKLIAIKRLLKANMPSAEKLLAIKKQLENLIID